MTNRPITDIDQLVCKEIELRMRPFIEANMHEHEETRKAIKENTNVIKKLGATRTHSALNSIAIFALYVVMFLALTAC
jgi:hypothetical protein